MFSDGRRQIVKQERYINSSESDYTLYSKSKLFVILRTKHTITQTTSLCALFYVRRNHWTASNNKSTLLNNFLRFAFSTRKSNNVYYEPFILILSNILLFFSVLYTNGERRFLRLSVFIVEEIWWNICVDRARRQF